MRTTPPPPSACRQVLVIEDEVRLREMLVDSIREMGLESSGVASAEAALRLLDKTQPDIALLDLNLPAMSGMDLAEIIHDRWPEIQIIVLTGFGDLDAAKRAIRLDVVDFLTKPCGMDQLEIALNRARARRMERHPVSPLTFPQEEPTPDEDLTPEPLTEGSTLEDVERNHILSALRRNNGNREATAAELGISVRKLYYRLQQYNHH